MSQINVDQLADIKKWDKIWGKSFEHYQKDVRHAHYIRAILNRNENKLLEIAAGSFRDVAALQKMGIDCQGIDYSPESIKLAKANFSDFKNSIHEMSAFNMDFPDDHFDLTYHNGFWGYFSDEDIKKLATEQARISQKRIIATVHNAHNKAFNLYFEKMKSIDSLYDIRFFHTDEMIELMRPACKNVQIIPVGKGKKWHEDLLIKYHFTNPTIIKTYLLASKHRFLENSERLLCIGTI